MENYKQRIKNKGLKVSFVAKQIGVSPQMMSYVFKGERNFSDETADRLEKVLK